MHIDEHSRKIYTGQEALQEWCRRLGESRLREGRKLHYKTEFQDIPVSIENRKGSVRSGTDDEGEEWRTKMKTPYGYIPGTKGVDGDELDVFVGTSEHAAFAYVIHCNTPDGKEFDEDKIMLGFASSKSAKQCFLQHYDDNKFFGGIDAIPMWQFRTKVFVKKHTTKKLVASRNGASLQVPPEYFEEKLDTFGRGTDRDMKKSILGHHQDIMPNPEVREGGPGSGPHGHDEDDEEDEKRDERLSNPKDKDPRNIGESVDKDPKMWRKGDKVKTTGGQTGEVLYEHPIGAVVKWDDTGEKEVIKATIDGRRDVSRTYRNIPDWAKKKESQEHGVQGQKWGVRHARNDGAGQKGFQAKYRDLANDPKTMNMMQVVHRSQPQLNAIAQQQRNRAAKLAQQNQKPPTPEHNHDEALEKLKDLGWEVGKAIAGLTGIEGIYGAVSSAIRSPNGQKLFLNTDKKGNHNITTDKEGKALASRPHQPKSGSVKRGRPAFVPGSKPGDWRPAARYESESFRESKKTYYARPLQHYGTDSEESNVDFIREAFPKEGVNFPKTKRHAELGMGYFHKKIDAAKRVVLRPLRGRKLSAGVFSEARHALKNRIPVYAIHKGKMRRVKSVEALTNPNRSGQFGRLIFKKSKKK